MDGRLVANGTQAVQGLATERFECNRLFHVLLLSLARCQHTACYRQREFTKSFSQGISEVREAWPGNKMNMTDKRPS